jgi:hypothetical protein
MVVNGRVHNGVVVLEGNPLLPEGLAVTVTVPQITADQATVSKKRIQLPLVPSDRPGTLELTGERIAELLEEDDVSP